MPYKNPDYQKIYQKKYRETHKEKFHEYNRNRTKTEIEKIKQIQYNLKYNQTESTKEKRSKYNAHRTKIRREIISNVKIHYGCQNPSCQSVGQLPSCCLDFHHIDQHSKEFDMIQVCRSFSKIAVEICKCTVLCANCHRLVTKGDLDTTNFTRCLVDDKLKVLTT